MIEARRTYFYANGTLPHCPTAIEMNRPGGPGRGMAVRKTRRRSRQAAKPSRCGVRALPDCLHDVREDGAPLGAHRGRGGEGLDTRVSSADDAPRGPTARRRRHGTSRGAETGSRLAWTTAARGSTPSSLWETSSWHPWTSARVFLGDVSVCVDVVEERLDGVHERADVVEARGDGVSVCLDVVKAWPDVVSAIVDVGSVVATRRQRTPRPRRRRGRRRVGTTETTSRNAETTSTKGGATSTNTETTSRRIAPTSTHAGPTSSFARTTCTSSSSASGASRAASRRAERDGHHGWTKWTVNASSQVARKSMISLLDRHGPECA
jgi:hypothetical protein